MNRFLCAILLALLLPIESAWAKPLSQRDAVALAEEFIVENGYTAAGPERVKPRLDFESLEFADSREDMLKGRYDTLRPKAIGAKKGRRGRKGWSIAFDYVPGEYVTGDICRVVTMDLDGSGMRVEHVDGLRTFFAGFK